MACGETPRRDAGRGRRGPGLRVPVGSRGVCRDSTLLIALCFQAEALQDLTFLGIHFGRQSRRASRDLTLFGVHMTPAERRPVDKGEFKQSKRAGF